ncbi:DUF2306 domain-containing protein [Neobacillus sp. LXY-4]|uniref:DUF2306 domain-containing protein n=1 Tax=Neobacillus sp. LXY-4 TaxID=3379826 RepID=UPI003EE3860F
MLEKKNSILVSFWYISILLFVVYIIVLYIIMDPTSSEFVERKLNLNGFSYHTWLYFFYTHLGLGIISLASGPFQFLGQKGNNQQKHRYIGTAYTIAVFINSLIVPFLALYVDGGLSAGIAFFIVDAAWLVTTWIGVWRLAQNKFNLHRDWMIRSYAVTMVFMTYRIVITLMEAILELDNSIAIPLGLALSAVLNLMVVEGFIRSKRRQLKRMKNVTA